VAASDRAAARDEQLPRVHGDVVSGSLRGRLRTRDQLRAGHDQADRAADHRPGLAGEVDHPVSAGGANRSGGRRGRVRTGWAGCGPAAHPGGPRGGRARTSRPHRRPASLRHPGIQAGEAPAGPTTQTDAPRGHHLPGRNRGRRGLHRRPTPVPLRRDHPRQRRSRSAGSARRRPRPARYPSGNGVPDLGKPSSAGRCGGIPHHRRRPRRRDHRRRRHRDGLFRHGTSPAGTVGGAHRHPRSAAGSTQPADALADLPGHLPDRPRARGRRPSPVLPGHPRLRR
jgi:hypothetical protein